MISIAKGAAMKLLAFVAEPWGGRSVLIVPPALLSGLTKPSACHGKGVAPVFKKVNGFFCWIVRKKLW